MPKSILEAIKLGLWEFEPAEISSDEYDATGNMPGTREKLDVLAERVAKGQPLWHPSDREDVEDPDPCDLKAFLPGESLIGQKSAPIGHSIRRPR